MFRRLLAPLLLLCVTACSESTAPTAPAAPATPAPAASPAPSAGSAPAAAATTGPAPAGSPASMPAAPARTGPVAEPRPGVDFEVLPVPQPTYGQGGIEVVEVFGYSCIHCAQFQPVVNQWMKTKPADVRWEYVPGAFGGVWDNFARAYLAADALGVAERTHDAVFNGVFVEQKIKSGSPEEIADLYASLGVDRARFTSTTKSFGVTAKFNRAKQFALRAGVNATPTLVVNGKYRLNVTPDRGFEGMLDTVDYLVARERAGTPAPAAPAPAES